jgi:cytochrome P450
MAGFETTINGIGTSLWQFAHNTELRSRLAAEPTLILRAVEGFLRYYSPVQLFGRNVTRDFEYGGQPTD